MEDGEKGKLSKRPKLKKEIGGKPLARQQNGKKGGQVSQNIPPPAGKKFRGPSKKSGQNPMREKAAALNTCKGEQGVGHHRCGET